MRLRDLGITVGQLAPGPRNAITDVEGVRVGAATIVRGDGPLVVGQGPVRTGVTVIVPHAGIAGEPLFAGCHRLNGNGELTGLEWVRESGTLTTPVAITNTHSVGVVRDALALADAAQHPQHGSYWSLPVVGETYDGTLNDINGAHVTAAHVHEALARASDGPVPEGNIGGGTGMICHEFKGGTGTASRRLPTDAGGWTEPTLRLALQHLGVVAEHHRARHRPSGGSWSRRTASRPRPRASGSPPPPTGGRASRRPAPPRPGRAWS